MRRHVWVLAVLGVHCFHFSRIGRGASASSAGSSAASGAQAAEVQPIPLEEIGTATFDNAIAANRVVLVLFYAPWCGKSAQLKGDVEKALGSLNPYPRARVAGFQMDASLHLSISERYRTDYTPVLILIQAGTQNEAEEYSGTWGAQEIAKWVETKSVSHMYEMETDEQLQEILKQNSSLPFYVARGSLDFKQRIEKLANTHRSLGTFLYAKASVNEDSNIQVFRGFRESFGINATEFSDEVILQFMIFAQLPDFWVMDDITYEAYLRRADKGMLWAIFNPRSYVENATVLRPIFEEVAREIRETVQLPFVFVDASIYSQHVREELGCTQYPVVVLQLGNLQDATETLKNYRLPLDDNPNALSKELLSTWIRAVLAGKVPLDVATL